MWSNWLTSIRRLRTLRDLTPPKGLEGVSLRPLLDDPDGRVASSRIHAGPARRYPGHSVRTERWRYTEWGFGGRGQELYDHDTDPQELHNLATDAKYADVVSQMKELLKEVHPAPVQGGRAEANTREKFSN